MTDQHDFNIQRLQGCLVDLQNIKQDAQLLIKPKIFIQAVNAMQYLVIGWV